MNTEGKNPSDREAVLQALSKRAELLPRPRGSLHAIPGGHRTACTSSAWLDATHGNKTQAAKTLRIDYKTLLTKLKKYELAQ